MRSFAFSLGSMVFTDFTCTHGSGLVRVNMVALHASCRMAKFRICQQPRRDGRDDAIRSRWGPQGFEADILEEYNSQNYNSLPRLFPIGSTQHVLGFWLPLRVDSSS